MNISYLRLLEIGGVFFMLSGVALGIVGAEVLNIPFARMDLVSFAVGFCGFLLLVLRSSYEKNKTREQQIEEKDERVVFINQNSKSKAFDLLITILPLALLTLVMFGYMNKVSFFSLIGLYFISIVYYYYSIWKNKKIM
ncbi:hypothetical protein [Bacillus changyiensis]|uniref:hypothetical protein n=1 Tax=Bacillus changyiensis TaxID=3004103 RepID=UPI0022E741C0|nr:hypothetical protein [Bacillus changyiensis]MDA1477600.1 hypothetical protein [Bacillus changyiensis]